MSDNSQDSLARAIGGILWKGYDDLISTISGTTKKKHGKLPQQQIPSSLSKREDSLSQERNKEE